jgi:hypothetical protein
MSGAASLGRACLLGFRGPLLGLIAQAGELLKLRSVQRRGLRLNFEGQDLGLQGLLLRRLTLLLLLLIAQAGNLLEFGDAQIRRRGGFDLGRLECRQSFGRRRDELGLDGLEAGPLDLGRLPGDHVRKL